MPLASNKDVLQELSDLMKEWESIQNSSESDPTPILTKFCHLFERETKNFLKQDPDPFDDRHPVTSKPDCALGQCLRSLFRRNAFVTKLVTHYVQVDYFSSMGTTKDATELNTIACRLILNLTYGMDIPEVFRESESQVKKLFEWAENGPEPLRYYAIGLLASAMDVYELASSFKDETAHLIPIMLSRLRALKEQGVNINDPEPSSVTGLVRSDDSSYLNSDCSNSSWAEMGRDIVGTFEMHPLSKETKEIFILRFLRPISEYQEALPFIYQHKAMELVFHYINIRKTNNSRLSYEALRFLGSLLFHKKICVEFVSAREANSLETGIHKLLRVPRPSLPADGVALCLWYLAYCEEAVEKICQMSEPLLSKLVSYSLWLMECSHQSSQMHAIMFFGMVFKFRIVLERFDEEDGLRRLMNILTTLPMLQEDDEEQDLLDDSNDNLNWQIVKQVFLTLDNYFEAHLFIKSIEMHRGNWYNQISIPYKAINRNKEMIESHIEFLRENLPARPRWEPVEQFVALKGHQIIIKLLARMLSDSYNTNQDETVLMGLECLYVCSVLPLVQSVLCEKVKIVSTNNDIFDVMQEFKEVPAYSVLIDCLHENLSCGPDIQKAALEILVNCCCAPIYKPFRASLSIGSGPYTTRCIRRPSTSNEDILKRSWDCVRTSNGIMNLVITVRKKVPISDIDSIRALACRVLCGLARSDKARQIIGKLQLFTNGELQLLMKEPILPDKIIEHVKFQKYSLELTQTVSGIIKSKSGTSSDISMFNIRKADVISKTRISYNKKQLLQLIQKYLAQEGFETLASTLQREASLPKLLPYAGALMGPPCARMNTPSPPLRMRYKGNLAGRQYSPLARVSSPLQIRDRDSPVSGSNNNTTSTNGTPHLQIRINKMSKSNLFNKTTNQEIVNTSAHLSKESQPVSYIAKGLASSSEPSMSLDKIVNEYLSNQHSLCKHPVVTCPTFDLFEPHRCPEPKPFKYNPINFTLRHIRQPYDNRNIRDLSRRFIYSKYRLAHTLKSMELNEFVCACFMPEEQIAVGTVKGDLKIYNKITDNLIASHNCFGDSVTSIHTLARNNLVLASSAYLRETSLWSVSDVFDHKGDFPESFSNFVDSDKLLTTTDHRAKIFDLNTKQVVSEYIPQYSNHYEANRADVDPMFDLLLTDGVLFDINSGKEIHKFDKMNEVLNGRFHKNGLEIVSSSEIWDLRTFHLLRSAPILSNCDIDFNATGDVIFAVDVSNNENLNAYETSFKVVDASDYSSVVTFDTRRKIFSFSVNSKDTQIALVERDSTDEEFDKTAIRFYDIGLVKDEDEETIEEDEDDDDDDDDDEDDLGSGDSSDLERQIDDRNSDHSQFDDELEVVSIQSLNSDMDEDENEDSWDDITSDEE